ncbi:MULTISPECIES: tripartite tricarboxylate transporter TctB family protein [unclassified Halomonas]|uniref:tripartite tricarboxylate transporter TctB family protein n=1 Tax=unclassified Halomonas TaxID=2609666 RepID=UPI00209CC265|nr:MULTISPECIES: tripartite tricarboxylate transporter TctB family protein [unclassified Halomonas]MCP1315737.1 tripartite tricarboxylate transporter TctB family protein [Halomonas sp. 707D7]MCP1325785.1 tripartite tricarboxylate transporter TctB family protein [Halomonas sp. 707D4]
MTRLNTNQWLALVLALVAAAYIAMAWQIPTFPLPRPVDSDLFPKVLGFTLLLLSVFLFFEKPAPIAGADTIDPNAPRGPLLFTPWARVIVTALAVAAYALLLVPLGFVLASTLLCVGLTTYYGYHRYFVTLATTLGVVLSLYLVMTRVMDVYLPTGVLPF